MPADVYSLTSTLYAALAGRAAFAAPSDETLVPMLARIASAPVPDLRPEGVPDDVCAVIERGMAKDPADRFQQLRPSIRIARPRPCAIFPARAPARRAVARQLVHAAHRPSRAVHPARPRRLDCGAGLMARNWNAV